MSRRIRTVTPTATDGNAVPGDAYSDRIVKLIPADVVAAWLVAIGAVKAAKNPPSEITMWSAFAVACVVRQQFGLGAKLVVPDNLQ